MSKNIREQRSWYSDGHIAIDRADALKRPAFYRMTYRRFLVPWRDRWIAACPWHRRPR